MDSTIVKLESANKILAEATRLDDVKEIRDKAEALRQYAKQTNLSLEGQNYYAEIKIKAERRAGELLIEIEMHKGGRPTENPSHDASSLSDLGISYSQSSRWQQMSKLPDEEFEQHVEAIKTKDEELTSSGVLREARRYIKTKELEEIEEIEIEIPEGTYQTLVVDPPWPMVKIEREVRPKQVKFEYPTMTEDELRELFIPDIAAENAHLYLWVTQKFLPMGLRLVTEWGFRYQCLLTWVKNVGFTPFSWMYSTEHVIFARKGSLDLLVLGKRLDFKGKVQEHSRKPDVFYDLVREVSPGPRIDVFSQCDHEGFEAWGKEAGKFTA